ncbi:MAG: DUF4469 domain-containing protein [Tannerellaceae bacterium]|jgi:hypothetical protein|nr:DUF4469 domain-containing protein [Tannerellaceae bacterium]
MQEEKNTVIVELYDSTFPDKPCDHLGRTVTAKSLRADDLINIALQRRTDLNAGTLRAALGILAEIAIEELANGASVEFGPAFLSLAVKGAFVGSHPRWNPAVNSLRLKATPGVELRAAINSIHVNVRGKAAPATVINKLTDVSSGQENKRLTPGGGVELSGRRIKIAGPSPDNGIRLHHQDSHAEYPIPAASILLNNPKKVAFVLPPSLPPGPYKLSLATQYSTSPSPLREPHTYLLAYTLEVE